MRLRYFICDVFTDTRFGGNQLAVLPEAAGLADRQMQQIAREFNFSESTFVLPPQAGNSRSVRIFTPMSEVPFAGHPNVGTAFVLATMGVFGPLDAPNTVTFEEQAGLVAVSVIPPPAAPTVRWPACSATSTRRRTAPSRGASRKASRWGGPVSSRPAQKSGTVRS
jgi:predicted PhzF superfamily epimerase YddE/YHI9